MPPLMTLARCHVAQVAFCCFLPSTSVLQCRGRSASPPGEEKSPSVQFRLEPPCQPQQRRKRDHTLWGWPTTMRDTRA
ncbi:hypothetical protein V5799_030712 [Amblyomma americanum]|uniref:Secreted protein n=1 Tax=Amblyomma americanum TaxID=6943 RepID=A0AAQ4EMB0_AMBAM